MGVVDTFTATSGATNSGTTTQALTVPRAVASGSRVALAVSRNDALSQVVGVASIADSRGNTWVLTDAASMRANVAEVSWHHSDLTTGLQVGDTITVTWNSAAARKNIVAHVITGVQAVAAEATSGTSLTAGTNSGVTGSSSAPSGSTAGATTTAQCVVLAAVAVGNTAAQPLTAGSGYTAGGTVATSVGTNDRWVATEYMTTSSAGVQTAAGSMAASSTWAEAIVAYPLSSAVPTVAAGADQVRYAGDQIVLRATVTGTTTGGAWSQVSGSTVTPTTINATTSSFAADVTNTVDVVRVFRYTATYSGGSVTDDVTVTVPASQVLTASGGVWVAGQAYTA